VEVPHISPHTFESRNFHNPQKLIGAPKAELRMALRLHQPWLIEMPLEDPVEEESNSLVLQF
jgi:hypothetical protein